MKKIFCWKLLSLTMVIIALIVIGGTVPGACSDDLNAEEILNRIKDNTSITDSGEAIIKLITENSKGVQRENKLKIYRQEAGNMEKQLLEYLEPADVEGTKFLSINDKDKDENQMWLYLPALGRERRIAGHMTKDNFMGTDFTFEEVGGGQDYNDEYQGEKLTDEELDGYQCYHLKLHPLTEDNEYSQLEMWVWQQEMMPLVIEFYVEDKLSKKLSFSNLEQEADGDYLPKKIIMADITEGSRSIIEILESSSSEVDEFYFTMQYLRR